MTRLSLQRRDLAELNQLDEETSTMTDANVEAAAQFLMTARRAKRPGERLPESARPHTIDEALAIQRRVGELLGLPIGGWKCSLPSAQRPVAFAPIYAPTIQRSSPCPILPIAGKARIEPEIAFVMGTALPRRSTPYSEAEVRAAIGETRTVLELIGPRYADPAAVSYPELLADGIANLGLFVGPLAPGGLTLSLDAFGIVVETADGTLLTRDGKHPDGHPLPPLVALANYLAAHGDGLAAGQIVTTGSYCGVIDVPMDTRLAIKFGDFATMSVTLFAPT
jgi:2-keto-4-pentenoate hydratase